MLFSTLLHPGTGVDVQQLVFRLREPLDAARLAACWQAATDRHEVLRTAFRWDGIEAPEQAVWTGVRMPFHEAAWAGEAAFAAWLRADRMRGLEMDRAPLQRVAAFRRAEGDWSLVWTFHHAILDGRGWLLVLRDVFGAYDAAPGQAPAPTSDRPFREYLAWFHAQDWSADEGFWRGVLDGFAEATPLPAGAAAGEPGAEPHEQRTLTTPQAPLEAAAAANGLTLNALVQAAWGVLLARHAGRGDVVFGTTRACRRSAAGGADDLVGPVINTVPARLTLAPGTTLLQAAQAMRGLWTAMRPHEHTPLQRIQEWAGAPGRLFHTIAVYENRPTTDAMRALGGGWAAREVQVLRKPAVPLTLSAYGGAELRLTLTFDSARFSGAAIDRLLGHLRAILLAFAADPGQPALGVELLGEAEKATLAAWGDGGADEAPETGVRRMARAVVAAPDAVALEFGAERISYGVLDARANRLANHLRRLGVGPDVRVGLCLERTPELCVAALAIARAGGAYVPVEPHFPPERIAGVMRDADASVFLAESETVDRVALPPSCRALRMDADAVRAAIEAESSASPAIDIHPESLSHVIYTSGSTGTPKGVMIRHGGVATFLAWMAERFPVGPGDRVLGSTSFGFDVHVAELHHTLVSGATLVLVRNALSLAELPADPPILQASMAPSAARELLSMGALPGTIRRLNLGGEAIPPGLARSLYEAGVPEVHNLYGPTEDTTYSTHGHVPAGAARVTVGRPVRGCRAHVVDAELRPVPIGVPGGLYLAGAGVARGYLGRPGLTAEKFIPNPFGAPGERMYTVGDRVRWTEDGELEYLGRVDFQVKVRGFRIEPGEIESVLREHAAVRDTVVVARQAEGGARLVAYVAGEGIPVDALRTLLRARLPEYMVPAAFVVLDRLPLNANGKTDRGALPDPAWGAGAAEHVAPATPTEGVLAALWAQVLGVERVGAHDDFFALGGHSLLAMRALSRLRGAFGVELPLGTIFQAPTVRALAARVEAARGERGAPPVVPVARAGDPPASFAQERMWVLDQVEPDRAAYVVPTAVRLRGALDADALERALAEVVRRHDVLRTVFRGVHGAAVQVIGDAVHPLAREELSHLSAQAREAALARRAADEADRPFDLGAGPLHRFTLVRLGDDDHALLLSVHHAVFDGWSAGVLFRELDALYAAFAAGEPDPLAPLPVQYADFAVWQRDWLRGEVLRGQLAWWTERLAGAPAVLALPTDRPRPPVRSGRGARVRSTLPAELADGVEALARRRGATPYMVLMAAFQALMGRYAGVDDLVVGTPIAGRARPEVQELIGLFVNTLALRGDLSGDPAFGALVERTRESTLGAFAHQDLPFEKLVEALQPERSMGHSPVFQVMLAVQSADDGTPRFGGLDAEVLDREPSTAKFDLFLALRRTDDGLAATLEYATDLWDAATAGRMLDHFRTLLAAALATPDAPLSALPLADPAERARVAAWSGRETPFPRTTVDTLFAQVAAGSPDAVAVVDGYARITYAELDARANRLARHLRGLGVTAGTRVGICLERGAELIVATLAVLKAGGAYVPLDPAYPAERLAFMLADTAVPVLVTDSRLAERLPAHSARVVAVDADANAIAAESGDFPDAGTDAESVSYVMYTSGSTGRPKGIEIPHRAIARLVRENDFISIDPSDVFLQLAPASFDAATLEIWGPLLNGARLAIHPAEQPGVDSIEQALETHGVTILWLTAGLFHLVVDERIGALRGVRQLLAGGDVLSMPHVRRVLAELPGTALINGYGPTENTTFTCCHRIESLPEGAVSVPIGRPIANTRVHVLDAAMQPVPAGVPGELYTGGAGLALGYLDRPELTAETFVADPFTRGGRLYRTGDRARWLADGTIDFLGRMDQQVKVRGFRIEPGEIEAMLTAHPGVRDATVVVREDVPGDRRLVAYVVGDADGDALRAQLKERLPEYMVPAAVVVLDALPLTPNGKVDRRALPAPSWTAEDAYEAPATPTEEVVAGVWAAVLGVERVGAHDDFFALGGHSLLATRAVSRLRELLGVELALRALFEAATVRGLAARVDALLAGGERDAAPAIVPVPRGGPLPLSFAQERLWILDQVEPDRAAYVVPTALRLRGPLDAEALERALAEIVRRHETLRAVYREGDGGAVQVIDGAIQPVAREDLRALPAAEREAALARRAADEAERPFDLAAGPLYRFGLLRLADDEHALLLTFHHSVFDGWSVGVLFRELSALYAAFAAGRGSPLPEPAVQYADFAAWQRGWLRGEALEAQVAYWTQRLRGAPALLELPTDRPRPLVRSGRGGRVRAVLPAKVAEAVESLARREGATPYMVLMAAFQALLARYSGQDDVVVGTPIAGRTRPETQELIGFFVNTLALRAELGDDPSFGALLARTREATLGAFAHQDLPFEKLVERLQPERSLAHSPVFQVMLAVQNADEAAPRLPGVEAEVLQREWATAKFDLLLALRRTPDGLSALLEYASDLWDAPFAERMVARFGALLAAAVAEPERPLSHLPLLAEGEAPALAAWHSGGALEAEPAVFPARFAEQVRRTPDAVALIHDGATLTYAELDARANQLAHHLRALGVGPEVRAGVCLERTPELIVALLAVLKAGGAYVPVEPHFPAERIAQVMRDAGARLLVVRGGVEGIAGVRTVDLEAEAAEIAARPADDPTVDIHPETLAHVIYTSGSTGGPKGVMIRHGAVGAFVAWMRVRFPLAPGERVLGSTSVSFDVHVAEVHFALASGAALVLVRDALALAELDLSLAIAQASMVPGAAHELLRLGALPGSLRRLNLAGEALTADVAHALYAAGVPEVHNVYGPTEDTTYSTHAHCTPEGRVTIGRPFAGRRAYVLDERLRPVPAGVVGQLYLAGGGVARGYLGRPDLTAAAFVPDPLGAPGARMYATGDRARWLADGQLEYLGRADQQLKVRGFRIEPGEVEGVLRAHPAVRNAVVGSRGGRLVAWIAAEGDAGAGALAAHVRARLPEYMVPAAFVAVDAFPRTASGKIDRRALPEPAFGAAEAAFVAPRTPTEEAVAGVWAAVLGVERVGAHDDFFALGGHSLLATRVVVHMRDGYGVDLPLRAVFATRTVAGLAARIDGDPAVAAQVAEVMELMRMLSGVSDEQAAELLAAQSQAEGVA